MSIFDSEKIIKTYSSIDKKPNISFVGFDLDDFRYKNLVEQIQRAIVDFTYGFHDGILETAYNYKHLN